MHVTWHYFLCSSQILKRLILVPLNCCDEEPSVWQGPSFQEIGVKLTKRLRRRSRNSPNPGVEVDPLVQDWRGYKPTTVHINDGPDLLQSERSIYRPRTAWQIWWTTSMSAKNIVIIEMQRNDEVKDTSQKLQAIESFNYPFVIPDKDKVYCISSGALASVVIEVDILRADSVGRDSKDNFITNRLEAKVNFLETIKRLNLKTMSAMHTSVKVTTLKNKTIEYKQQGNVAFQLLVKSQ